MPRKRQRRTGGAGLGRVVVDHVQDHLDARRVQRLDHRLELGDLAIGLGGGGVAVVRREERDRVVTPVVGPAARRQLPLGDELMHRHQLDGGHAQPGQVVDDGRAGQARIGAALPGRDPGMAQGQAADMRLVDHRLVIRRSRRPVTRPVEIRVGNDIARHERGAVAGADRLRRAGPAGEQGLVPAHLARDGLAVRVEQQLRRIAPVTAVRRVRAVHAIPVALARADAGQVAVPDVDLGGLATT